MKIGSRHWLRFLWATSTEARDDRCAPAFLPSRAVRVEASRPRGLGRGAGPTARDPGAMASPPPVSGRADASAARRPLHGRRYRAAGEGRGRGGAEAVLAGLSRNPAEEADLR